SHDEVVHGKGSLLGRMPGDDWQRFANLRAYFAFMWTHPGKKLLFMGGEFAQDSEWNHDAELSWHLLQQEKHAGVRDLVCELNALYRSLPALHRLDCDPAGFAWVAADDAAQSVIAYLRNDGEGSQVLVVCNFTPVPRDAYRVGSPQAGAHRLLLNSDARRFGGSGYPVEEAIETEAIAYHGHDQSLELTLPPLATLVLELPRP
ncbi:MAG: alpha amylase C-terminal domain-containing protein, partial [Pseudomonadota bacterium]